MNDCNLNPAAVGCDDFEPTFQLTIDQEVSNSPTRVISWTELSSVDSYYFTLAQGENCQDPLVSFQQEKTKVEFTIAKDGTYKACVEAHFPSGKVISAQNSGAPITLDTQKPSLKDKVTFKTSEDGTLEPEMDFEDLSDLEFEWSAESSDVLFKDTSQKKPGLSFKKDGTYTVKLKVPA